MLLTRTTSYRVIRLSKKDSKAARPPADAPMPTIGKLSGGAGSGLVDGSSAGFSTIASEAVRVDSDWADRFFGGVLLLGIFASPVNCLATIAPKRIQLPEGLW